MANASGFRGPKQTGGYFVPLGNCVPSLLAYTPGTGAGGSFLPGSFALADWATNTNVNSAGALLSTISSIGQGGLLRDMGRTVVSSNRTFRKVQLISQSLNSGPYTADGVVNAPFASTNFTQTSSGAGYLTAYLELSTGRAGVPRVGAGAPVAPVAYMPGLI